MFQHGEEEWREDGIYDPNLNLCQVVVGGRGGEGVMEGQRSRQHEKCQVYDYNTVLIYAKNI